MLGWIWLAIFVLGLGTCLFQRSSISVFTIAFGGLLVFFTMLNGGELLTVVLLWLCWLCLLPFAIKPLRAEFISKRALAMYRKVMPKISSTEREALEAGTVWWDRQLFSGRPVWSDLLNMPYQDFTEEEKAFIDGPLKKLCSKIDDWQVTTGLADLPPDVWQFLKEEGFFGLIIPKEYGGKGFSARAHAAILVQLFGCGITIGSTVAVPNSLGPAELLLHYGTDEQKNYYLPRLARGEEIPCFALTSPLAGSDAAAMPDSGVVCQGEVDGQTVLGIRLTWDKRYITLAPVATVLGLAFKLYDPDGLLGKKKNLGITCALIPTNTPGVEIGRRHWPLNAVFQNGPTRGKDVFIPLDWVIGGASCVGQGWRMLMECLSAGRSISLPSSGVASCKVAALTVGAYGRIRRQFNLPIGRFEGIQEAMAEIVGYAYQTEAMTVLTQQAIDQGEKPSVLSGILKYHCTELGRKAFTHAMDIHGGKGICMGESNYLARGYQGQPIAITVEGANILTRNLIVFGQGAMRCHPFVLKEIEAASLTDEAQAVIKFDQAFFGHVGFAISNFVRSFVLGLSCGYFAYVPVKEHRRYLQYATRWSSAFALLSDVTMLVFGGALKRKERISARLGDILSYLYILSSVIKQHASTGYPEAELSVVQWSCEDLLFKAQEALIDILNNYPNRWLAGFLRFIIMPFGPRFKKPSDQLDRALSDAILSPTPLRQRLVSGLYLDDNGHNLYADLERTLEAVIAIEPLEKQVRQAVKEGKIAGLTPDEVMVAATRAEVISTDDYKTWKKTNDWRMQIIHVDDFLTKEMRCTELS